MGADIPPGKSRMMARLAEAVAWAAALALVVWMLSSVFSAMAA
jgi:hypothetical protein